MAALVALVALIAWLGILPMRSIVFGKMDDIQKFHTIRENRERQVARLPELEGQFQEIVAGEDTMHILLEEDHIVDFVKTLEGLAREENVEISIEAKESSAIVEKKVVKPTTTADDGASVASTVANSKKAPLGIIETLPFDRYLHIGISLKGEYGDMVVFLHKMETLPYALDVVGFDLSVAESTEKSAVPEPGRNPFMLFSSGSSTTDQSSETIPAAEPKKGEKPLKANFDTVVYIQK
jgi:hypothetical protein